MRRLLCSSDPLIGSLRKQGKTSKKRLPKAVLDLLAEPEMAQFEM